MLNRSTHPISKAPAVAAVIGAAAALLGLTLPLAGCNIVAPIAYLAAGPPTTDAKYTLDDSRVTVIYIDDRFNRAPRRSLRVVAAEGAEQALMQEKALPEGKVITTRAAMRVVSQEQFTEPMTVAQIGRSVGAEVVIYAVIDSWILSPDGVTLSPEAKARVKVIDADADHRLWPQEGSGYPVIASLPTQIGALPTGAERDQMNLALAKALGTSLAEVFYKHPRGATRGRLGR